MSLDKFKIQKTVKNFIGHFDAHAKIKAENIDKTWQVNIDSEEASILIGRHGQTLQALEHLLRLILDKESEDFLSLRLDISGYKASREQEVIFKAKETAERVISTGQPETLMPMNSYERRVVHLTLSAIEAIETESVGVEPYRKIVIKKK